MSENKNPLEALLLHVKNRPRPSIFSTGLEDEIWYRELVGKTQALRQQIEGMIEWSEKHNVDFSPQSLANKVVAETLKELLGEEK